VGLLGSLLLLPSVAIGQTPCDEGLALDDLDPLHRAAARTTDEEHIDASVRRLSRRIVGDVLGAVQRLVPKPSENLVETIGVLAADEQIENTRKVHRSHKSTARATPRGQNGR